MKTIADIKRKMVIGSLWRATYEINGMSMGVRPVSIVQSNSFAFRTVTGSDSWCDWPKRDEVTFYPENENKFTISHDGRKWLTYELVETTQET